MSAIELVLLYLNFVLGLAVHRHNPQIEKKKKTKSNSDLDQADPKSFRQIPASTSSDVATSVTDRQALEDALVEEKRVIKAVEKPDPKKRQSKLVRRG